MLEAADFHFFSFRFYLDFNFQVDKMLEAADFKDRHREDYRQMMMADEEVINDADNGNDDHHYFYNDNGDDCDYIQREVDVTEDLSPHKTRIRALRPRLVTTCLEAGSDYFAISPSPPGGCSGGRPAPPPHRSRAQKRFLRCQGGDTETTQVRLFHHRDPHFDLNLDQTRPSLQHHHHCNQDRFP